MTKESNFTRNSDETSLFFLLFKADLRLSIPSLCGILVYNPTTSTLIGNEFGGIVLFFRISNSLNRCGVSCKNEGISGTKSFE